MVPTAAGLVVPPESVALIEVAAIAVPGVSVAGAVRVVVVEFFTTILVVGGQGLVAVLLLVSLL
jgi:hypothetical protein